MNFFEETKRVSDLSYEPDLMRRLVKLQEEAGELAAPTLQLLNYKPRKGKTEAELIAEQEEEGVDVVMVGFDILHRLKMSEERFHEIATRKLAKWESHLLNTAGEDKI